jgi:ABC-type lipoprotein export system ATPase subunit
MNGPSPPPGSTRSRRGRMPDGWLVEAEGLVHIYKTAELEVVALQGLDLRLAEGETIAIAGRSGSGKTTLATHDAAATELADRVLHMEDGVLRERVDVG